MELLSPAGNLEAATAAFQYGADAVYLGLHDFSARADADNFSLDELNTLLGLAHNNPDWPRKVYIAVNTLVNEQELDTLVNLLAQLSLLDVDGLIIQDWAVYQLVRDFFPHTPIHASTQLAIHNVEGALRARELGFQRIVLARELSLPEIERISAIPDLETEVFIHGALCYAYSGLCLLSAALRGDSGNRGACQYVCRNCYQVTQGAHKCQQANVMSMKDLATPELLGALRKARVDSLKIEGRKKTPLYVAAVTNYYRNLLDNTFEPGEQATSEHHVKTIFSRPWTTFHLKNRRLTGITDIHTVGPRGDDAGTVTAVVEGMPDQLRFTVKNQPLEKHDGLQVEIPGRDKPYGFPVDAIRVFPQRNNDTWKNAFEAPADTTIEVPLPEDHPDIPAGSRIFCTSSQAVKRSYHWDAPRPALCKARCPIFFHVTIQPEQITIVSQATVGDHELDDVTTVMPLEEQLTEAKQPEKILPAVTKAFSKLGDTDFTLADLKLTNPENLYVPASMLNEARRMAAADVQEAVDGELDTMVRQVSQQISAWKPKVTPHPAVPTWTVKVDRTYFLNLIPHQDLDILNEVVFSMARTPEDQVVDALQELENVLGTRNRIRVALPPIVRPDTGYVTEQGIKAVLQAGFRRWEASNIGSLKLLEQAGANLRNLNITADWSLFVNNFYAAKSLLQRGFQRVVLSPDDTWENWLSLLKRLAPIADVPVYQHTPLAYSDVCINSSLNEFCPGRKACNFTTMKLDNPRKDEHLIAVNNRCQSVILNQQPFNLAGHLNRLAAAGAQRFRAEFCWLDLAPTAVQKAWNALQEDRQIQEAWTANLFPRV